MPRHRRFAALALGATLLGAAVGAEPPAQSPQGDWTTQGGEDVVRIEPCGEALCGHIVGIVRAPGEPIPTDSHRASQCGLLLIDNERPEGRGAWLGHVIDPRNGRVYKAKLWVDDKGDLRLHGFIAIPLFGRTQTWRRFTGHVDSLCQVSGSGL